MALKTLTLRKPPDPQKIAQSIEVGMRFVDRKGRYILQTRLVTYGPRGIVNGVTYYEKVVVDATWVDVPLVPETYGEAQA